MKIIDRLFSLNTIRRKMIVYFLVTILLISIVSIFTFIMSSKFMKKMESMFVYGVVLTDLSETVTKVNTNLNNYLSTKHSDSLNNYLRYSDELREKSKDINKGLSYDENRLLIKDIAYMIETYLDEADKGIAAKRGRNIDEYLSVYTTTTKLERYIDEYINKVNFNEFNRNTKDYLNIKEKLKILQQLNIILILDVIILTILIIYSTTYKMTEPIIKLSHNAEEIAKGNFDIDEVIVPTNDEIKVMAVAFNKMKSNIKEYIKQLRNTAQMEAKLMDQELQNLKMKNLLNNAELQALQSQINPHFLFNTLNAGVQLAMMEGADTTSNFLENMSALFRYNIKKLDNPVTLKEEIENIKSYSELLKVRFGDFIDFEFSIDNDISGLFMPPLILQPLVENACIHGVGDLEDGGKVRIVTRKEEGYGQIIIEDNGVGMSRQDIEKVLKVTTQSKVLQKAKKGHTTGIGLGNVIHRLHLYFGRKDIVQIISEKGMGTKIIINIPFKNKDILTEGEEIR
ncbi:hypothetical protein SH1V18_27740 [Vallitalea longa]|uniref:HAMP domain-containing protein n=1 Tax=Vallitalea longa TaxID=2936439 RepID=A0A9W5YE62_9FIRM|nr:histidine kinase [Vallitalea longa]GKX30294.1 hypothetical protein SH1V18_27740 [Vallitalea longa]